MRYFFYILFITASLTAVHPAAAADPEAADPAAAPTPAPRASRIVVDASGHGDFLTIQAALNSLPDDAPAARIIFIRKGVYREKIFVEKNNLILEGEDKDQTILSFASARDAWRCDHPDDWGVATLNLRGSDITLKNLSILNTYGFDNTADHTVIPCAADSANHQKTISRQGHQMALRSFQTTRLKVINCILKAFGGDTVSPWNVSGGLFYFKDCTMEGGVDFYCPRGWAYAEHCTFIADNGPACIWHDGSADPDSRTVLKDCSFSGYDGFKLGRYHRDAQFYLIHCNFAENMADQDIYLVPTNNMIQWGRRVYYFDCHKKGTAYSWYADNLDRAPGAPDPAGINPHWVFKDKWDPLAVSATPPSPAIRLAATAMATWIDTGDLKSVRWTYEEAVVWLGLIRLWYNTGDARYFKYVRNQVDRLVDKDGNILTYKSEDYSLDNILCGRLLLLLYETTGQDKYYKAATRLQQQLKDQPRTTEGGFWHKKKYPQQVWLDGLYMAQPFYAQYAALFHEDSAFDDITRQFVAIEGHTRDPKTGLLYHGWDASGKEKWALKTSGVTNGHSPNFWGRAMGWYGMAMVDALEYLPGGYPGRKYLLTILQRYAAAIQKVQDPATGLWWDILDKPGQPGNYPEASATAMFVYTLARGVRLGYLPPAYLATAQAGYRGLVHTFIGTDSTGATVLGGTVSVSGLGGNPYRDGSYAYYTSEKTAVNDQKGVGAFLLAAVEMDMLSTSGAGKGQTVLLDYYFNNERRKDITGASVRYHYTWEDRANSGFSLLGHLFRQYGAHTDSLPSAPTAANLKNASVYIIVDPDDEREVPAPHYPGPAELQIIYDWVEHGGSLVLLSNDSANAEFTHFNTLAAKFGIQFNYDDYHKVTGNNYEMGAFTLPARDTIFKTTNKIYIKELSTLQLSPPAKPYFRDNGHVIMAVSNVGKGRVFAVGDPWFYNEYTDGRKLPADYENYNAARDLVQWLLQQPH
jgi:unsaturated rhamnogalacturonyl hydrolase